MSQRQCRIYLGDSVTACTIARALCALIFWHSLKPTQDSIYSRQIKYHVLVIVQYQGVQDLKIFYLIRSNYFFQVLH